MIIALNESVFKILQRGVASPRTLSTLVRSTIEVRCCKELYEKWNEMNLKPHLPKPRKAELRMPIEYFRTPKANDNGRPTILAFHGSPGSAEQFQSLGNTLYEKAKVDFIVPSFPDINYTIREGEYFHSAEEKVEVTETVLQGLGVKEVDVVIGYSAGCYPATLMALNQKRIRIKSLAVICSPTSELIPAFRPPWFHSRLVSMVHIPGLKRFVIPAYKFILLMTSLNKMLPVEAATAVMSCYATRHWYPGKADDWFRRLNEQGVPRMAFYSSEDFVVPTKFSKKFVGELGNPDEENHYSYEGKHENLLKLVHTPINKHLPPVVHFINGGHSLMQQFPTTVADHLLKFCENIISNHKTIH